MIKALSTIKLLLLCLIFSATAEAKRVALVIGNSQYQYTAELANPNNDAKGMARSLRAVGFNVILGVDLTKSGMEQKLREFASALNSAKVGLFFYAGHGLQVANNNYLVPIDAKLEAASALDFEAISLKLVLRTMERATTTNILFLDACRNNPLSRNLARSLGTRSASIGRGLARLESGAGTLISFATQPGNVALDGDTRHSPYTASLMTHITSSTDDITGMLIDVRNDVMKTTNSRQVPWDNSAMTSRFYFRRAGGSVARPVKSKPSATNAQSAAAREWAIVDKSSPDELKLFLGRHPNSTEAIYAKSRLARLRTRSKVTELKRENRPPGKSSSLLGPQTKPSTVTLERLAGTWRGWYAGSGGRSSTNEFDLSLSVANGRCSGRIEEPNTFGRKTSLKLYATVDQCRLSRNGGRYQFSMRKKYDGTAGVSHYVAYSGDLSVADMTISGKWRIRSTTGDFSMRKN